ncbi:MAG: hypothetical protein JXQ83_00780 [Candidatus Glassbacteria bacterium]|nr:hypothetical protein [Candidatus Glassbacteria bacterium]
MTVTDPRTAVILAERMVGSFFEGLSEAEKLELVSGKPGKFQEELPPGLSMLAYTLDVYLEELSLPEEQGREFFKEAVRKKIRQIRSERAGCNQPSDINS